MADQQRAAFEAWWGCPPERRTDGEYAGRTSREAWRAWQAAIAQQWKADITELTLMSALSHRGVKCYSSADEGLDQLIALARHVDAQPVAWVEFRNGAMSCVLTEHGRKTLPNKATPLYARPAPQQQAVTDADAVVAHLCEHSPPFDEFWDRLNERRSLLFMRVLTAALSARVGDGWVMVREQRLRDLTEQLPEHPDDWDGPRWCATCRSYAAEDAAAPLGEGGA